MNMRRTKNGWRSWVKLKTKHTQSSKMATCLESRPWWVKNGLSCMMALSTGKPLRAVSKVPWLHQSGLSSFHTYSSFSRGQTFKRKMVLTCGYYLQKPLTVTSWNIKLWSSVGKYDWVIHMLDLLSWEKSFTCTFMNVKACDVWNQSSWEFWTLVA